MRHVNLPVSQTVRNHCAVKCMLEASHGYQRIPFTANDPRRPRRRGHYLGLTVLVVEDSRFACEALRLLCMRSGARIRRADTLRAAYRHFRVYRPTVVVVDLGLPDGNGIDLIAELDESPSRVEGILAISGDAHREEEATGRRRRRVPGQADLLAWLFSGKGAVGPARRTPTQRTAPDGRNDCRPGQIGLSR